MIWLTKKQIIHIHADLISSTGGSDGLRDEGLLESALSAPFQTFDNTELFPSLIGKAVRLSYGLTQNHPFVDGNKRIGAHALLLTLALNGIQLGYTQEDLTDVFLQLAAGSLSLDELHEWVVSHIAKGEF